MKNFRSITLWILSVMLVCAFTTPAFAASAIELSPSVKTAFNLTAEVAESSLRTQLNGLYSELTILKEQYDKREDQIRILHHNNEQALIVVRKQIKDIDAATVTRLESAASSTKQRYQPLFDQYTALNRRISLTKSLKDKSLNAVLRSQGDAMKILVQIARQDIRDKQEQLKAAKDSRSKKMAAARKTLAGIDSSQITIKSQKSISASLNKRLSADWSDFKAAIRKQNPFLTSQSLSSLVSIYRQIAASKQKIIELEQKISVVIANTKKQTAT